MLVSKKDCWSNNLHSTPGLMSFFKNIHLKEKVDISSCSLLQE